jgi:sulfoquinovosidase
MRDNCPFLNFDRLIISASYGHAQYQMNRGTFKTKDKIHGKTKLTFDQVIDGIYWYQSNHQKIGIKPLMNENHVVMEFINQSNFNRLWISYPSSFDEHFYGCGEQFSEFDLKGKSVNIWVSEHHSVKKILKKFIREKLFGVNPNHIGRFKDQQTYYAQPTFLSSKKYLIHSDSNVFQTYHFKKDETVLFYREIPKAIHVLKADSFLELATLTSELLGKQPQLPKWTEKGIIIASQGGIEALKNNIKTAKENHMKLVGVWSQDWSGSLTTAFGYQVYWNWQYSESLYSNLKQEIEAMSLENIAFLGYINTFLKEDTKLYLEAKEKGYFVKTKQNQVYHIKSTTFHAGIIDLTNPSAYQWYKNIIKTNMIDLGMKGWMADFGEYLPTDSVIYDGNPEHVHNIWPSLWARLNKEAILESKNKDELFFFSRAGYTETIKHANTMWAGDQHVDFSKSYGLPSAIVSSLSLSTIGIGVNHSDIGGYTTILHMKRSKELLIRWLEMNLFSPILRCHEGNQPSKNAQFDHDNETLLAFSKMSNYFEMLSPYLSELKNQYETFGYPIIRPIFYHYDEPWAYKEKYQFLYGEDLLISPVILPNQTQKEVRLPKGNWIGLMNNITYQEGIHLVEAKLGTPIAFYKENSKYKSLFEKLAQFHHINDHKR